MDMGEFIIFKINVMKTNLFTVSRGELLDLLDYLDPNEKAIIEVSQLPDCYDVEMSEDAINAFKENEDYV